MRAREGGPLTVSQVVMLGGVSIIGFLLVWKAFVAIGVRVAMVVRTFA
jgi:hypothetical protein